MFGQREECSPAEQERDLGAFNAFAEPLYARERSRDEELEFLRRQGPYVPSLVEALRAQKDRFAAVVFFTYLYYTTHAGLSAAPERSALVPTTGLTVLTAEIPLVLYTLVILLRNVVAGLQARPDGNFYSQMRFQGRPFQLALTRDGGSWRTMA